MKEYNNNLKTLFKTIALDKGYKVVGSAKSNLFFGDYDLNSLINYSGKNQENKIYNEFKKVFQFVNHYDNIWITDLKVGEDEAGNALRWNEKTMKSNDNQGYTFQEALKQKSTIKIDITLLLDDKFVEITDNYFFTINDYKTFENLSKNEMIQNLKEKYIEYLDKKAYLKSLKRLKSMLQINGNNKREMKLLNDFFNSKIGYLYTVWSEISVIAQLLELKKKVSDEDIYNAIQRMKEDISFFPIKNLFVNINKPTKKGLLKVLDKQNEHINEYINKEVCSFIKKSKLLIEY